MFCYHLLKTPSRKFFAALIFLFVIFSFFSSCGGDWKGFDSVSSPSDVGAAKLYWTIPYLSSDATLSNTPSGFIIYFGNTPGHYRYSINVGNVTEYTINSLSSGTWYFALTSYDNWGNESALSNELGKYID
ncbi:MAG: hypothetical protein GTO02_16200 [Candidatus Dadabacteria bacterium]|nr:hypothetical protein [Candidatus Dadabacteria bacterium]